MRSKVCALALLLVACSDSIENEIPAELYPENGNRFIFTDESNEACNYTSEEIRAFWDWANRGYSGGRLKKFMEHAAHSSNGFDAADCKYMSRIYQNEKEFEANIEVNMEALKYIPEPGE